MQQSTACLHFRGVQRRCVCWRSCLQSLPGLRRGGGGRLAGAAVLSCLAWRCELALTKIYATIGGSLGHNMERNAAKETAALAAAHLRRLAVLLEKKQPKNVCISDEKVAQPRPTLGTFSAKTFPKTITHASRGFSGTARVHMVCTGLSSDEKRESRMQNAAFAALQSPHCGPTCF